MTAPTTATMVPGEWLTPHYVFDRQTQARTRSARWKPYATRCDQCGAWNPPHTTCWACKHTNQPEGETSEQ